MLLPSIFESHDTSVMERAKQIFFAKVKEYNKIQNPYGRPARFVRMDDLNVVVIYWDGGWKHRIIEMEDITTDALAAMIQEDDRLPKGTPR